jgi:hypothetical protein
MIFGRTVPLGFSEYIHAAGRTTVDMCVGQRQRPLDIWSKSTACRLSSPQPASAEIHPQENEGFVLKKVNVAFVRHFWRTGEEMIIEWRLIP